MLSEDTHRFILYIRDRIEQGKPVFRGRTGSGTVHSGTKDQTGTGVYTIMYKKCSLRGDYEEENITVSDSTAHMLGHYDDVRLYGRNI